MRKGYFGKGGEEIILERHASHGYKKIKVSKDLGIGNLINFRTEGDCLVLDKMDGSIDISKDAITFICKSFGVSGDIKSKISVIFCDDGNMVVTLYEGMLCIEHEGKVITPVAGDVDVTSFNMGGVYWVTEDTLLSLKQYFGTELQGRYTQDFEYVFTVCGGIKGGCTNWSNKCHKDEYKDLSLGFIAEAEEKIIRKKRQNEVETMNKLWSNIVDGDIGMQFDEDYDDDEEYEEDEDEFVDDEF